MKSVIKKAVLALVPLCVPILCFAQANGQLTREQVRNELSEVEKAGYNPSRGNDPHYPEDIQAAEARVAAQHAAQAGSAGGVGGVRAGSGRSGRGNTSSAHNSANHHD